MTATHSGVDLKLADSISLIHTARIRKRTGTEGVAPTGWFHYDTDLTVHDAPSGAFFRFTGTDTDSGSFMRKKTTIPDILKMKQDGRRIAVLTAYDFPFARLVDAGGVDIILVGDSAGVVVAGHDTTLPITMDEMLYHVRAVKRADPKAVVVADMPFMSYQTGIEDACRNCGRMIKEGGAEAVKVEGGSNMAHVIRAVSSIDIPVMAHIGLTPQSVHRMGGYKVQGRSDQAERIMDDAFAVQHAGAFAVVLEGIPASLAAEISAELTIPTIGIGAGPSCDGQVLVIHDILGLCEKYSPKFVKRYADLGPIISSAVTQYVAEVRNGEFPTEEHSFS
jgi:3-methyl-2-oxobutanoate hydroxymethyltransferase